MSMRPYIHAFKSSIAELLHIPESKISLYRTSYDNGTHKDYENCSVSQIRSLPYARVSYEVHVDGELLMDLYCDYGGDWKSSMFVDDFMDQPGLKGIDQICRRVIRKSIQKHMEMYHGREVMKLSL